MQSFLLCSVVSTLLGLCLATGTTEWGPLARGSWRVSYESDQTEWNTVLNGVLAHTSNPFVNGDFHYGANIRGTDGHIHAVLAPAEGPLQVVEVDSKGALVANTSVPAQYTDVHSMLRYLPNGSPVFGSDAAILSVNVGNQKLQTWQAHPNSDLPGPCGCDHKAVLTMVNSQPPQLLYADYRCVHGFIINADDTVDEASHMQNCNFSTVMFNHDGTVFYNDAFWWTPVNGIVKSTKLPLTADDGEYLVPDGCRTYPWTMASDHTDAFYACCTVDWEADSKKQKSQRPGYSNGLTKYSATGKKLWTITIIGDAITSVQLVDSTTPFLVVFHINYGNQGEIDTVGTCGVDGEGHIHWNLAVPNGCEMVNGPFAPRVPLPQAYRVLYYCTDATATHGQVYAQSMQDGTFSPIGTKGRPHPHMVLGDKNSVYVMSKASVNANQTYVQKIYVGYA